MTRSTPLTAAHQAAGATMTDFAGWRMPLKYGSELAEHQAVRTRAGLFDLSHMGQLYVSGAAGLDRALVGAISPMAAGRAKYTLMCFESGGVLDDLIVYRLADEEFLVIANAANRAAVADALTERVAGTGGHVADRTGERAMIAVQGPASLGHVQRVLASDERQVAEQLRYYRCAPVRLASGKPALLARTGYTGENGYELMIDAADALALWEALASGAGDELQPCGLAARDTLRLEAAMPLYGHELDAEHNPYEAGLGRVVALDKPDFVGKAALEVAAAQPPARVLVGLAGVGRRAARAGYPILAADRPTGAITSGALSPTLGHPIALGYVEREHSAEGTELVVDVRGRQLPMTVTPTPFYRRDS